MADIEQGQQMIPFITREIPFCQDVCELVLGVDVFNLDFGVQIGSIEQPIKSNSVGPGNMSHRWTSAFHNHFDYSFIVLNTYNKEPRFADWTFEGTESMSCITSILL